MKLITITLLFLVSTLALHAQHVEDFKLTNVLNDQPVSLSTYPSCQGIVIIFTTNDCPYDDHYRARIKKLATDYHSNVPILLVNSSADAVEAVPNMKKKASQLDLGIPYLADKDQVLMQRLGATKTPQAFLLKNNNGKFSVVYRGAIDDNAQVENDVRHAYLKDAIDIMLANQIVKTPEIRPVGCTIRRK